MKPYVILSAVKNLTKNVMDTGSFATLRLTARHGMMSQCAVTASRLAAP